ncbi:ABC transporter permease [Pontimonas sp.]|nr:ABC transporter permease [Pontimonas sp.]MDA9116814.1 ABC transporter permease [Pontimonas sp.]
MSTEVTPGIFSLAEAKVSWKAPWLMSFFSLLVFLGFGVLGRAEPVLYTLTADDSAFTLPAIEAMSNSVGMTLGVVMFLITGLAFMWVIFKRPVPLWWSLAFGLVAVTALLGWLAAGDRVPVAFILGNAIVLAIPIMFGGMAGVMSERVGVVNIAIEGQMLTGAFVAAVVSTLTGSLYVGLIAAMVAAALVSTILAVFAVRYLVDQIIVGVVLNVLVIGVTNFLYSQWLTEDSAGSNNPGTFDIIAIPFLSDIPIAGPALFENRVTVYLAFLFIPLLWFVLFRTRLGLRARAVGEYPMAADTMGVNVARTRFWWVTLGGALAGLGGAAITIGNVGAFGREMTGGQGFIALAVVILGRWHPFYMSAAALLFGFSIILRVWANQVSPGIPTDFIIMVPYLVTIIAVVGFVGKVRPPASVGKPYVKE